MKSTIKYVLKDDIITLKSPSGEMSLDIFTFMDIIDDISKKRGRVVELKKSAKGEIELESA